MANNKDFIVKNGLVVLAQGSAQSTSTLTGAIITPGGIGIGGNLNVGGTLTVGQNNFSAYDPNLWYVSDSTSASDTNAGHSVFSAFKTIKHALAVAQPGDTVFIDPGTYTEIFPLTIPQGVAVRGAGLRETLVQPTAGTNTLDAFLLNGESCISDFTVANFYKPGYAFKFATGAKITTRSPYIERFSVITKGSTITGSDPYGFQAADAGNGAYIDAGVLDATSLEPTMLFNEATFIIPNATGIYMTNGARAETVNTFFYFADKAVQAVSGVGGVGGVGQTKIRVGGKVGTFTAGDTLKYYSSGTLVASGTIASASGEYIYLNGPKWGFRTAIDVGTSTQVIFSTSTGATAATATSILLADYHQFGAELRSIGSAAVFGNTAVTANGTGTDLKLIAFNMSHVGSGGDITDDLSKVIQANEVIQINGGKVYYQTVDQIGDFRIGNAFYVNQKTGDVSFGTATVALSELSNLTITDGSNNTILLPTSITVGNLIFSAGSITSSVGDITIDPAGSLTIINSDVRVQGAFTSTGISSFTSNQNATSTLTGAVQVAGGLSTVKDVYVGGSLTVANSGTLNTLYVSGATYLAGDLYVDGASFIVNTSSIVTSDKTIILSSATTVAASAVNSGIQIGTGSGFVSFLFDGTSNWKLRGNLVPNGTMNLGGNLNPWNIIYGSTIYDNLNRVITSVGPSAGLGIAITGLTSTGPAAQFQVTNTGVLSIIAGTDTNISTATGNVTVWNVATLQSVTGRGPTTNQPIQITAGVAAISQNTGSLVVTGGVGVSGSIYAGNIYSNGAAVWTTASLTDNSQLGNGAQYLTSSTIGLYGVSSIQGGVGISVSRNTGSVTVTNIGVVSLTGNQYIGLSASSGSNVQIINLGVQQITTGSGIAITTSTGSVQISSSDTLQLVTARGATTNVAVAITATNLSASTSSGQALLVSGGIGALAVYASTLFDSGNRALTSVTPVAGTAITITAVSTSGPNTTFTVNNAGVTTATGSTYIGVSTATGVVTFTNLGVQTLTAGTDTRVSASTGTITVWSTSSLQSVTSRGGSTPYTITINSTTNSTSTNTGALQVQGGVGINQDLYVGGSVTIIGTINANTVVGSISTSTNLFGGALGSVPYQTASGRTGFIGIGSPGNILQVGGSSTATWVTTSSLLVGGAQTAVTATNVSGGFVSASIGIFSGVTTVSNVTASLGTNSGALQVAGGVGVGGNVYATQVYDSNNRVVTSVTPSAGAGIGISNLTSTGPGASWSVTNLGVQAASGTTYLGVSSTTGTVTFTNLGVQSLSGTAYLGVSNSTGTISLTNLGVQTLAAGTDTAVSASTGTVTVWTTSTLQTVTSRGATTDQAISITNATPGGLLGTGALIVSGGASISGSVVLGNSLSVTGPVTFSAPVTFNGTATYVYSTNTYYTDNIIDLHTPPGGPTALWTQPDGKDIGFRFRYWNRLQGVSTSAALVLADDTQMLEWYSTGVESTGTSTIFTSTNINSYGGFKLGYVQLTSSTIASSTITGALVVAGGVGIGGALYVGGSIFASGSQVVTAATLGSYGVSQVIGTTYIGVTPSSGTGTVTITNLGVQSLTTGSGIGINRSTGTVIIQSIDTLDLVVQRSNVTSATIQITNATLATSTSTGSLVVVGGAGFGGGIYVGGASTFINTITGTITTSSNIAGGTAGSLLYQSTAGSTTFLSPAASGNLLASNGAGPLYISTQTLLVGFSVTATNASEILGGTAGQLLYQLAPNVTDYVNTGTAGTVLVSQPGAPVFQNTLTLAGNTQATSTVTGAFQVVGGAGVGGNLYVGGTIWSQGSQVVTAQSLGLFGVAQIIAGTAIAVSPTYGTGTVTIGNMGVTAITSGSGITVSTSTGSVQIVSIDTLQLVTQRGPSTNQAIAFTNTNYSLNTATGQAVLVSGGIGALTVVATSVYDNGSRVVTSVTPSGTAYLGVSNLVTGGPGASFALTNLGVQTLTAGTDTAVSQSTGTVTVWTTSTLQSVTNRGSTTTNIIYIANTTSAVNTFTGALQVAGGAAIQGDLWARNIYTNGQIVGAAASTSSNIGGGLPGSIPWQYNVGLTSFIGIGTAGYVLTSNGSSATYVNPATFTVGIATTATNLAGGTLGNIPFQTGVGGTGFIAPGSVGSLLQQGASTATFVSTSSIFVGQSTFATTATNIAGGTAGQIHYQSAVGVTSFAALGTAGTVLVSGGTGAPLFQNTLTLAGNTQATSTTTGALNVVGGVGIGGNLWVGGTLYATVQGSINTATNLFGGATGSIPVQASSGVTGFLPVGTNQQLIWSNGTNPTYVNTGSVVVGGADVAKTSSNLTGGTAGAIPWQTAPGATSYIPIGTAGNILLSNGSSATWVSTASLIIGTAAFANIATNLAGGAAGSLPYQNAANATSMLALGVAGAVLQSNGSTLVWNSTATLLAGSSVNLGGGTTGSIPYQSSSGVTNFISPGATGTLLQMGAFSTATWVTTGSVVVGFANIASSSTITKNIAGGTAGQLPYQSAVDTVGFLSTGSAGSVLVSQPGAPVYQNTLTLGGLTQSNGTNSGALQVAGGVGIGGNLYVGGVLFATVQGSINTATNISGGNPGDLLYQSSSGVTAKLAAAVAGTLLSSTGVNSTPAYVSTTTLLVGSALQAQSSVNINGGTVGALPYQSAVGTTQFIGIGAAGTLLQSNGTTATWITTGSLVAGTAALAISIAGGAANYIPYQSGTSATTFSSNLQFNGSALTVVGSITGGNFIPSASSIPTNGMYLPSANVLGFATNSVNRINVDASGNVGIGKSPTVLFDVNGAATFAGLVTANLVTNATGASNSSGSLQVQGGAGVAKDLYVGLNTYLLGNVSMGGAGTYNSFITNHTGGALGTALGNQVKHETYYNSSSNAEYLEITSTRAAAGTSWTTAGFRLQQKVDSTWMGWMQFNGGSTTQTNGGITWGAGTTTVDATSVAEMMRLDTSGNLVIGSQAAPGGSNGLYVQSAARFGAGNVYADAQGLTARTGSGNYGVRIYPGGGSVATYSIIQFTNAAQTTQNASINVDSASGMGMGTDIAIPVTIRTNGTTRVTIDTSGNMFVTGDVYSAYSDLNLKTVLGQIEDPLALLRKIDTFYYEPNAKALELGASPGRQVGVSAQSVQLAVPEAVHPAPINNEYLTVQYERLVPLLIESIKKLEDTVKAQQQEINQLKNK